jgi:hypothetical protein
VEEFLEVIRNRLIKAPSFPQNSPLQVVDVMELLDICLAAKCFQFEDKFYQQNQGMAIGNYLRWSVIYLWNTLRK